MGGGARATGKSPRQETYSEDAATECVMAAPNAPATDALKLKSDRRMRHAKATSAWSGTGYGGRYYRHGSTRRDNRTEFRRDLNRSLGQPEEKLGAIPRGNVEGDRYQ